MDRSGAADKHYSGRGQKRTAEREADASGHHQAHVQGRGPRTGDTRTRATEAVPRGRGPEAGNNRTLAIEDEPGMQAIWRAVWRCQYSKLDDQEEDRVWADFTSRLMNKDGWHPLWGFIPAHSFNRLRLVEKTRVWKEFITRQQQHASENKKVPEEADGLSDSEDDVPPERREVDSEDEDRIEKVANEILLLLNKGKWKPVSGDMVKCPFCNRKINPSFCPTARRELSAGSAKCRGQEGDAPWPEAVSESERAAGTSGHRCCAEPEAWEQVYTMSSSWYIPLSSYYVIMF